MNYYSDGNLQIEDIVTVNGIKENIILSDPNGPNNISFCMVMNGLRPEFRDKAIVFIDAEEQIVLYMPEPFMVDANEEESTDVQYELNEEKPGRFILTVEWSKEWVSAQERVFPVTVDPSLNDISTTYDTYIRTGHNNTTHGTEQYVHASYFFGGQFRWGLLYFDLSAIPYNSQVTSANLKLNAAKVDVSSDSAENVVRLFRCKSRWDNTATWKYSSITKGTTWGESLPGDFFPSPWLSSKTVNNAGWHQFTINIATVQNWVNEPKTNYGMGMMIFIEEDLFPATVEKRFYSSESGALGPKLTVNYNLVPQIKGPTDSNPSPILNNTEDLDIIKKALNFRVGFPVFQMVGNDPDLYNSTWVMPKGITSKITFEGLSRPKTVNPIITTSAQSITFDHNNLNPNTSYSVKMNAVPLYNGNPAGLTTSFTLPLFNTTLNVPRIDNPQISNISAYKADFQINVNTACQVFVTYWKKGDTQKYNALPNPTVVNSITTISLDGLISGTEYEYSYYLKWPAGDGLETTRSEVFPGGSFTTALATDVTYLYDLRYWTSEVDQLTVNWSTPSDQVDSLLRISMNPDMSDYREFHNSELTTSHSITVSNLSPGQNYYVQFGCTQATNSSSIEQISTLHALMGAEDYYGMAALRSGTYGTIDANTVYKNIVVTRVDICLPGRMPLVVSRYFNSIRTEDYGLGSGWSFNYDSYLRQDLFGSIVLVDGDGSQHVFRKDGTGFLSAPGKYASLSPLGTGYQMAFNDGSKMIFVPTGERYWVTQTVDRFDRSIYIRRNASGQIAGLQRSFSDVEELTFHYANGHLVYINTKVDNTDPQTPKTYRVNYLVADGDLKVSDLYDTSQISNPNDVSMYEYYFGASNWFVKDSNGNPTYITVSNNAILVDTPYSWYSKTTNPPTWYSFSKLSSAVNVEYLPHRTEVTDYRSLKTTYEHYSDATLFGAVRKVTLANGGWMEYTRDENYNVVLIQQPKKDALNIVKTELVYDSKGNLILQVDDKDGMSIQTKFGTEPEFNLIRSVTDPEQMYSNPEIASLTYNYDHLENPGDPTKKGLLTSAIPKYVAGSDKNANYEVQLQYYDNYDLKYKSVLNTNSVYANNVGTVTYEYEYDSNGLLKEVYYLKGTEKKLIKLFKRDLLGKLLYAADGNGMVTKYEYDEYGRILKQTRPTTPDAALRSTLLAEVPGLIIASFDAPIHDYVYEYENIYDANGNATQSIDAMGKITENKFDELNRLVHVKDPGLNTTYYGYDASGNMAWQSHKVDQAWSVTEYMYNELNKIEKMTDPSTVTYYQTVYEYDLAGRVTKFKEGCDLYVSTFERMTKYNYNNLDQVENTHYYLAGNDTSPTKTIGYAYDRNGNVKSYSGPIFSYEGNLTMTAQYTYNDASQVTNLTVSGPGDSNYNYSSTLQYGGGRLLNETISGQTTNYKYDEAGQLWQLASGGQTYTFTYYNGGQRKQLFYGNLITAVYEYDQAYRMTDLRYQWTTGGQSSRLHYAYEYDPMGRRLNQKEDGATVKGDNLRTIENGQRQPWVPLYSILPSEERVSSYQYDDQGRLTAYSLPEDGYSDLKTGSFQYDMLGNRVNSREVVTDGTNLSTTTTDMYVYQLDNKLVNNRVSSGSITLNNFGYDKLGQQITDGAATNTFCELGRITRAYIEVDPTESGGTVRRPDAPMESTDTRYYYSSDGVLRRKMEVNEENEYYFYGSGGLSTVKSNGISHHFSRLGGQLLGSADGFFILQDARGDVVALVSNGIAGESNGKIVGAYTYDAFGSTRSIQEIQSITSPFRFAGGLYDSSSGNYIFGVRMYAPDQGRWLSKDSYLGSAEDPLSLHRYVYCQNDPVNFVDPSGFDGLDLNRESREKKVEQHLAEYFKHLQTAYKLIGFEGSKEIPTDFEAAFKMFYDALTSIKTAINILLVADEVVDEFNRAYAHLQDALYYGFNIDLDERKVYDLDGVRLDPKYEKDVLDLYTGDFNPYRQSFGGGKTGSTANFIPSAPCPY
jgi:RHS repeat-associated protein